MSNEHGLRLQITWDASLVNSYQRGNLDDFFHAQSGDPGRDVDAGSSAFFNAQLLLFKESSNGWRIGAGAGYYLPADHALWGTKVAFGGGTELVLKPGIVTIPLAVRAPLSDHRNLFLIVEPALALSWVDGYLDSGRTGSQRVSLYSTPKYGMAAGFQALGGLEAVLFDHLAASIKGGVRSVKPKVLTDTGYFGSSSSSVGDDMYQVKIKGEDLVADLSGTFVEWGLSLIL